MKKTIIISVVIIAVLVALVLFGSFYGWTNFANAANQYGNLIISFLMLIVTIITTYSSFLDKSIAVKPYLSLNLVAWKRVSVEVVNNGNGLALIEEIQVQNNKYGVRNKCLKDAVEELERRQKIIAERDYKRHENAIGYKKALSPGDKLYLLEVESHDTTLMQELAGFEIRVRYTDIYGKRGEMVENLSYFCDYAT